MNTNTAVKTQQLPASTKQDKEIEFRAFGGDSKVKLSIKLVLTHLCKPTKKNHYPSESDVVKFMMLCEAKALNPWESDAWLVGYDGNNGPEFSMITGVQAFYKRAEVNPEYDGIQSGVIIRREDGTLADIEGDFHDEGETVVGGWAKVYLKNRKFPVVSRLRIGTFRKGTKFWDDNPAGQICKCAEADSLRRAFPTKLGGLYMAGEIQPGSEEAFQAAKPARVASPNLLPEPSGPDPVLNRAQEPAAVAAEPEPVAQPAAQAEPTPQAQLLAFIAENGFTVDHLLKWGEQTGNIPGADSLSLVDEVPAEIARKILKAKQGLLLGLRQVKG